MHTLRGETGECEIARKSPTAFIIRPHDGVNVENCAHDAIFALTVARARSLEDFWKDFNWETYLRHMSIFIDFDPKLVPGDEEHHKVLLEWRFAKLVDKQVSNILSQIKAHEISTTEYEATLSKIITARQKLLFHSNSTGLIGRPWCWINVAKIDGVIARIKQQKIKIEYHNILVEKRRSELYVYYITSKLFKTQLLSEYLAYTDFKLLSDKALQTLVADPYPLKWLTLKTSSLNLVELLTPPD
jgi:hypothetical protein